MKTKPTPEQAAKALKALHDARMATLALAPQQLTLATSGQREPAYVPGMDYPGYTQETK